MKINLTSTCYRIDWFFFPYHKDQFYFINNPIRLEDFFNTILIVFPCIETDALSEALWNSRVSTNISELFPDQCLELSLPTKPSKFAGAHADLWTAWYKQLNWAWPFPPSPHTPHPCPWAPDTRPSLSSWAGPTPEGLEATAQPLVPIWAAPWPTLPHKVRLHLQLSCPTPVL